MLLSINWSNPTIVGLLIVSYILLLIIPYFWYQRSIKKIQQQTKEAINILMVDFIQREVKYLKDTDIKDKIHIKELTRLQKEFRNEKMAFISTLDFKAPSISIPVVMRESFDWKSKYPSEPIKNSITTFNRKKIERDVIVKSGSSATLKDYIYSDLASEITKFLVEGNFLSYNIEESRGSSSDCRLTIRLNAYERR